MVDVSYKENVGKTMFINKRHIVWAEPEELWLSEVLKFIVSPKKLAMKKNVMFVDDAVGVLESLEWLFKDEPTLTAHNIPAKVDFGEPCKYVWSTGQFHRDIRFTPSGFSLADSLVYI